MMISIIIPTFNRADLITETIVSVQNQSFSNWEAIIVDDHSTDNTIEVVNDLIRKDSRISFFIRPAHLPKGANSCRNFGLLKSKGEFVKWMDSDDLLVTDCFDLQVNILIDSPEIMLCLGYSQFFDSNTRQLEELWSRNFYSNNLFSDHITNTIRWGVGGPLWRKSWLKHDPYCNDLKNSQEWLMHGISLLLLENSQIYNFTKVFCHVRRGHERMSSSRSANYYWNQVKARLILFKVLTINRKLMFSDYYQLLKQSFIYGFHAVLNISIIKG